MMQRPSFQRDYAAAKAELRRAGHLTTLRLTVEYDGTRVLRLSMAAGGRARSPASSKTRWGGSLRDREGDRRRAHRQRRPRDRAGRLAFNERPLSLRPLAARAATRLLPRDCRVRDAAIVDDDFSARFSARERTYVYAILNRPPAAARCSRAMPGTWRARSISARCARRPRPRRRARLSLVLRVAARPGGWNPASTVRTGRRLEMEPRGLRSCVSR